MITQLIATVLLIGIVIFLPYYLGKYLQEKKNIDFDLSDSIRGYWSTGFIALIILAGIIIIFIGAYLLIGDWFPNLQKL